MIIYMGRTVKALIDSGFDVKPLVQSGQIKEINEESYLLILEK